jgi:hypothetical protein
MSWTSLKIAPGLVRNTTRYATAGTWFDCSLVRFRDGTPEKWAGWEEEYPGLKMDGICRSLHRHGDLQGFSWVSAGTSKRFYMLSDDNQWDVTPWAGPAVTLGTDPLSVTDGSTVMTITQNTHQHFPGDTVFISGATAFAGLPDSGDNNINREYIIQSYVDDNHYTVTLPVAATATTTGGGAAVQARYLLRAGTDDYIIGGGWGSLTWNEEEWGGEPDKAILDQMGIWSQDNWGEDLLACPLSGGIYYWDATTPQNRMINILDIPEDFFGPDTPGADGHAPQEAEFIIISHRDRHCLAFGASAFMGGGIKEPMSFRWCSQENILNWDDANKTTGTAGTLPLSNGSKFVAGHATAREILVWTDQAMYSVQYVGAPLIYVAELLDRWSDIAGMKAVCSYNGVVYWMGRSGIYAYSGRTEKVPCPIWGYVSDRMDTDQFPKIYASANQKHNEVLWFYPSAESGGMIDSYIAFNVMEQIWTFGNLHRTAWLDVDALHGAIAATDDGRIFAHDVGADDGSTSPVSPLNAFIESGPIELSSEGSFDKGDKMMFVRRILPDVTFREGVTSSDAPQMNIVLRMMDKPGGGFVQEESRETQRTATIPIEEFTEEAWVRLRGRSMTVRAESNTTGTNWRMGIVRIDARTDGQR